MAYGQLPANFNTMNEAQKNDATRAAGYTGLNNYNDVMRSMQQSSQPIQSSSTQSYTAPTVTNNSSWEDTVQKAIEMQKKANEPAVTQLQSQIPQIQSSYAAQTANVTAKSQTLADRYKNLIDTINTSKTADVNKQTVITSNELGKRGLLPSSTLAQQEVQNAVSPITDKYTGYQTTAALDQTSGQQEFQDLLNQLTSGEVKDTSAVNQAIASLQSGAATSGIQTGTGVWGQNQSNLAAQAAAEAEQRQRDIANQIAQAQLANQTAQTQYNVNEPYKVDTNASTGMTAEQFIQAMKGMNMNGGDSNKVNSEWEIAPNTQSSNYKSSGYYG